MKTLGQLIFGRISSYFKNLWFKIFKEKNKLKEQAKADAASIADLKTKLETEAFNVSDLKKSFEKQFGVKVEDVKKSIESTAPSQTSNEYLTQKLIEGRKNIVENNFKSGSQLLDPSIMNEHNELGGYTNNTLNEVKRKDDEGAKRILDELAGDKKRILEDKGKVLYRTRT